MAAAGAQGPAVSFGCELVRLAGPDPERDPQRWQREFHLRRVELVRHMTEPADPHVSYQVRLVSIPDEHRHARGRIRIAVLGRADPSRPLDARRAAEELCDLLEALFEDHEYGVLDGPALDWFTQPFAVADRWTVVRRCAIARLDTLGPQAVRRHAVGFHDAGSSEERGATISHVFPFTLSPRGADPLHRLLLRTRASIMLSWSMTPTALRAEERRFLEAQIAACERYAQAEMRFSTDPASLQPALRQQARAYQAIQVRSLEALLDSAGDVRIEICGAAHVPRPVVDMVGMSLSGPVGGHELHLDVSDQLAAFMGGYEAIHLPPGRPPGQEPRGQEPRAQEPRGQEPRGQEPRGQEPREQEPPEEGGDPGPLPASVARLRTLLDPVEAALALPLPPAALAEPSGLERRQWTLPPAPRDLPETGVLVGVCDGLDVRVGRPDRLRHQYVIGQTGTGKTTLLRTMILDDLRAGEGLCVIDPHGDLFGWTLAHVPQDRIDDVVLIDPTDVAWPVGLNLLEWAAEEERHLIVQELGSITRRLVLDEFGSVEIIGPLFFQHLRMNLLLAMSDPDDPGTLVDLYMIFEREDFWKRWVPLRIKDPLLANWVDNVLPQVSYTRTSSDSTSLGGYIASKFSGFVFNPMLRNILGQPTSTVDLGAAMDSGRIVLVNLARGQLTEENSRLFGMLLLTKLLAAGMRRVAMPESDRRPFYVYVDEFQSMATQSFAVMLSEARKFGLGLTLANQFVAQLPGGIVEAIFGNVGTIVSFRLGVNDAEILAREMAPEIRPLDLVSLPNWHAYMTGLSGGKVTAPMAIRTRPPPDEGDPTRAEEVRRRSRSRFARPRDEVERELERRFEGPG